MPFMKGVPTVTLQQLGGWQFLAMTGARYTGSPDDPNRLILHLPDVSAVRSVCIRLTSADLYHMTFMDSTGKVLSEVDGVFCDMLEETFTENTGLLTRF